MMIIHHSISVKHEANVKLETTTFLPQPVLPVLKGFSLHLLLSPTQNLSQLDTPISMWKTGENMVKGDAGTASICVLRVIF